MKQKRIYFFFNEISYNFSCTGELGQDRSVVVTTDKLIHIPLPELAIQVSVGYAHSIILTGFNYLLFST